MKKTKIITLAAITLVVVQLSGCMRANLSFAPDCCSGISISEPIEAGIICSQVSDNRADKSLDKALDPYFLHTVRDWLIDELTSTGAFHAVNKIAPSKKELKDDKNGNPYTVELSLNGMKWFVPDYEKVLSGAFAAGFGFGLVGGFAYGSIPTEVQGSARITLILRKTETAELLWSGEFESDYKTKIARMACDNSKTKAKVTGSAIRKAMRQGCKTMIDVLHAGDLQPREQISNKRLFIKLKDGNKGKGFLEKADESGIVYRKTEFGQSIRISAGLIEFYVVNGDTAYFH